MSINSIFKTVAFYDGACPLCAKEVRHYASLDRGRGVEWVDINQDMQLLNALGVSREQAIRRFHVLDSSGRLLDGACAFVALWKTLPYYRILAKAVYLTRSMNLLERAYRRFAEWRYRRRIKACASMNQSQTLTARR